MVAGGRGPRFTDYGSYAQYLREALARANRRYMQTVPPSPASTPAPPVSVDGRVRCTFSFGPGRDMASARTSSASHSTVGPSELDSLRLGDRLPACGTILAAGKMHSAFASHRSFTGKQLRWPFPLSRASPRRDEASVATSRLSLLAWRDASTPWRAAPTRCLGLCVAFASCAASSTSTRELPSAWRLGAAAPHSSHARLSALHLLRQC